METGNKEWSEYLKGVKKIGDIYWSLCPFHKEKIPSFQIYPLDNRYKCFGCQVEGNLDDLVVILKANAKQEDDDSVF